MPSMRMLTAYSRHDSNNTAGSVNEFTDAIKRFRLRYIFSGAFIIGSIGI